MPAARRSFHLRDHLTSQEPNGDPGPLAIMRKVTQIPWAILHRQLRKPDQLHTNFLGFEILNLYFLPKLCSFIYQNASKMGFVLCSRGVRCSYAMRITEDLLLEKKKGGVGDITGFGKRLDGG